MNQASSIVSLLDGQGGCLVSVRGAFGNPATGTGASCLQALSYLFGRHYFPASRLPHDSSHFSRATRGVKKRFPTLMLGIVPSANSL
jgi:hypothetical protein